MKPVLRSQFCLLLLAVLSLGQLSAQEICDNGIDDDNDGLVDLNDTDDCACEANTEVLSLVPNPSFEEFDPGNEDCVTRDSIEGRPDNFAQANCLEDWSQASDGTTDAWNIFTFPRARLLESYRMPQPVPSGASAVAFVTDSQPVDDGEGAFGLYKEYISTCLAGGEVLVRDSTYRLDFQIGRKPRAIDTIEAQSSTIILLTDSPAPAVIAVYGIRSCAAVNFAGTDCPENSEDAEAWELIGTVPVGDNAPGWAGVSITFTPEEEYAGIGIGGVCRPQLDEEVPNWSYYYWVDNLRLNTLAAFEELISGPISIAGTYCDDDLTLEATPVPGAAYQWYRAGVALPEQTDSIFQPYRYDSLGGTFSVRVTVDGECAITDEVIVQPQPRVPALLVDTFATCAGAPGVSVEDFLPDYPEVTYTWPEGLGPNGSPVTEPGSYTIEYFNGCQSGRLDFVVTDAFSEAAFRISVDAEPGCPAPTELPVTVSTNWNFESFLITDQDGFELANILPGDTAFIQPPFPFGLTVSGSVPFCTSFGTDLALGFEEPIVFTSTVFPISCQPGSVTITTAETTPLTFTWGDPAGNPIDAGLQLITDEPGIYTLTVEDGVRCPAERAFRVLVAPISSSIEVAPEGCGTVRLVTTVRGGAAPYTFTWRNSGGNVVATDSDTLVVTTPDDYFFTVTDAAGCTHESSATVTDEHVIDAPELGGIQRMLPGDTIVLAPTTVYPAGFTFRWSPIFGLSCSDCPAPVTTPLASTIYQLAVTAPDNGCTVTEEVRVVVDESYDAYFPTAFSPNEDGVNDVFEVFPGRGVVEVVELAVYDRWGGLLFTGANAWDGTSNGRMVPAGVYAYRVTLSLRGRRMVERGGLVVLVR